LIRHGASRQGPGWLTTALLGAALALLAQAAVTLWSNYLTRRDQHVEEADKCNKVAANLTRLMQLFDEFAHGWAGFG
jgi:hypothetical protein